MARLGITRIQLLDRLIQGDATSRERSLRDLSDAAIDAVAGSKEEPGR